MLLAFITAPALLLMTIAGTGALLGGIIVWARNRQRRLTAARHADEASRQAGPPGPSRPDRQQRA